MISSPYSEELRRRDENAMDLRRQQEERHKIQLDELRETLARDIRQLQQDKELFVQAKLELERRGRSNLGHALEDDDTHDQEQKKNFLTIKRQLEEQEGRHAKDLLNIETRFRMELNQQHLALVAPQVAPLQSDAQLRQQQVVVEARMEEARQGALRHASLTEQLYEQQAQREQELRQLLAASTGVALASAQQQLKQQQPIQQQLIQQQPIQQQPNQQLPTQQSLPPPRPPAPLASTTNNLISKINNSDIDVPTIAVSAPPVSLHAMPQSVVGFDQFAKSHEVLLPCLEYRLQCFTISILYTYYNIPLIITNAGSILALPSAFADHIPGGPS